MIETLTITPGFPIVIDAFLLLLGVPPLVTTAVGGSAMTMPGLTPHIPAWVHGLLFAMSFAATVFGAVIAWIGTRKAATPGTVVYRLTHR